MRAQTNEISWVVVRGRLEAKPGEVRCYLLGRSGKDGLSVCEEQELVKGLEHLTGGLVDGRHDGLAPDGQQTQCLHQLNRCCGVQSRRGLIKQK